MASGPELESFIGSHFRSIWSIEVLQFLAANPDASFRQDAIVRALRASDAAVAQSVASLEAVGLATVDKQGEIRFHAADEGVARMVEAAITAYRMRPDKIRRVIISAAAPAITAFADAFKLRKA